MYRTILIVEDDPKTVDLIRLYLQKDGYRVLTAYDGAAGLQTVREQRPDLVVLDLMLPLVDGLDVCRIIRAESDMPIIMLTARSTEDDTLRGLDLGADDYMTKPFSPRELVARIRTVLRRAGERSDAGPAEVRAGPLRIDLVRHEVWLDRAPVHLTPKEFAILAALGREPGRVFSRLELLERVFGLNYEGLERTVDVHVLNLRKKIEADPARPRFVQTVFGVGYKFGEAFDGA